MSTSSVISPLSRAGAIAAGRDHAVPRTRTAARPELLLLLVLAAVLDLWSLSRNGLANEYYSAAVRSMTESWHAFLFGSFDAGGVMTVDKPPLSLWVQALSARAFGFSAWSLLVPQALMGVATVGLAYDLTRRRFGRAAGFAAGLVLALTPITVAISRHNNPDALLVLCCTAALWAVVRGLEDGRTRWLVLAGVCVGLGFEAKMAAALLVVPGLAAAWLWVGPRGRVAAARQLAAAGAALVAVGLAWPVLVWLTPAADRPWVSGTDDNSIWSLILGYNGLGRLAGQSGGPAGAAGGAGGPGGGPGGLFGGSPGPLRLLNSALGGQAGWLLGAAVVAAVLLVAVTRLRRTDPRTGWTIAVGGAFAVTAIAFSQASGIFHPYYVSALAPFTAALVGAGAAEVARGGRVARTAGPLLVAGGVVTELMVLDDQGGRLGWLPPVLGAVGVLGAFAVAAEGLRPRPRALALAGVLGVLLIAPASWSVQTLGHATNGTFPAGGPASTGLMGGGGRGGAPQGAAGARPPALGRGAAPAGAAAAGGMFGGDTTSLPAALAYAQAHGGGTVAVASQAGAAGAILTANADVAGLGGFSGRESAVSVSWLADAVASGKVRWVLADGTTGGMPQDGRTGASAVLATVQQVGTRVASVSGLYDLQGKAAALRASAA